MTRCDEVTRVALNPLLPTSIALACTAFGAGLGFVAPAASRWAVDTLPDVPGPLEILSELDLTWSVPILTVVGMVAGILLALAMSSETLTLTVDPDGIVLEQNGRELYVPKARIGTAFRDGKDLVLTDEAGHELARRDAGDLRARTVVDAFVTHGYPWRNHDPHEGEFTRWVDGHPDLGDEVHALLRRRRDALPDTDSHEALTLHRSLGRKGIVVRDRGGHQEYRRTTA
ncbi:hypothetical protein [Rhodococcus sp. HNM0569]|uniref:YqeB family protein n=1 Tax=Rhodococcus sp. HNM0569 TaxID=2716340 RepID=UPI00146E2136|nr:hypothetical protein [Rhodococcus sp. HNM0569]NLU82245.1 hypothetical protein [Rhodococcus sp. HNM0569]